MFEFIMSDDGKRGKSVLHFVGVLFASKTFLFQQIRFEVCPHCQQLSYCSQYCREVHWTLTHSSVCRARKDESTVLCTKNRFPDNSAFETLPVHISHPTLEATAEITNELCYPTPSSSSSTSKKKSFRTLLSLLGVHGKPRR